MKNVEVTFDVGTVTGGDEVTCGVGTVTGGDKFACCDVFSAFICDRLQKTDTKDNGGY